MIIKINRKLENKVYTTVFKRFLKEDDADTEKELQLEDDFGPVKIFTGGIIKGSVLLNSGSVAICEAGAEGAVDLRFSVKGAEISLIKNAEFKYLCDAKEEGDIVNESLEVLLNSLQVAEAKCKIYEAHIQKKVTEAVEAWRGQQTDFETEAVLDINVPLFSV